ncbi:MAG: hypothetical protein DMG61_07850 [Acidobacteria bacterium]|nr:MAG: hypothetical protein DMG61_07850 [Acidobacteriota bacterium]
MHREQRWGFRPLLHELRHGLSSKKSFLPLAAFRGSTEIVDSERKNLLSVGEADNRSWVRSVCRIPCKFPANSLVARKSSVFMRVSRWIFFLREKIPCKIPCAGNLADFGKDPGLWRAQTEIPCFFAVIFANALWCMGIHPESLQSQNLELENFCLIL